MSMSDKDMPPPYPGGASVTVGDMPPADQTTGEDSEMRQLWRFIYVDMSYIKSIPGIIQAAELILSLLCIICVSVPKNEGCAYLHSGTYSYMEFTSSSCLISSIIWYALYCFAITKKIGVVRWDITQVIWCAFYALNYFIASCVLAAHVCQQGGYKAATAFGFLCLIVILVDGFLTFRDVYNKYKSGKSSSSQQYPTEAQQAQY